MALLNSAASALENLTVMMMFSLTKTVHICVLVGQISVENFLELHLIVDFKSNMLKSEKKSFQVFVALSFYLLLWALSLWQGLVLLLLNCSSISIKAPAGSVSECNSSRICKPNVNFALRTACDYSCRLVCVCVRVCICVHVHLCVHHSTS